LAPFAAGYERWLVERGFRPGTLPHRISQFACLSRWLEAEGLSAGELGPERVEEFLAARRAAGYVTWVSSSSLRLPLEHLREIGVVPASGAVMPAGPVDRLLEGYRAT
jgi:integrase/recombinase XerD